MHLRGLSGVIVMALGGPAAAQEPAAPNDLDGIDVRLAAGGAFAPGVGDAWVTRLEYEALTARTGPVFGFSWGLEYWRAGTGSWGVDLPCEFAFGIRPAPFRLIAGLGVDALLVDQFGGDTGVGLFAPLASVNVGVDLGRWNVTADARVTRRWQFGADDHTQMMVTVGVGTVLGPR